MADSPNIVAGPPPKPLPPPTTTLNVSELNLNTPQPMTPPKPGSGRAKLWSELNKKIGNAETEPAVTAPKEVPKDTSPTTGESPPSSTPSDDSPPPEQTAPVKEAPKGKEKVSPWKLVDEYKGRLSKAEKELADAKAAIVPEAERKSLLERVEKAEARAKELDNHIKFVDYTKSEEYQRDYEKPYVEAWKRGMMEISEIPFTDASGNQRLIQQEDMGKLVNMTLIDAKAYADEHFGDFSRDVLEVRKELRSLLEKKTMALEEARKTGDVREQQTKEAREKHDAEAAKFIQEAWSKTLNDVLSDEAIGPYFKPRDGDSNWNERLTKGEQLVNEVFQNLGRLKDPTMSASERRELIKRIVAVRNRAMGWSALKEDRDKLASRVTELENELKTYKSTTPPVSGTTQTNGNTAPMKARDRLFADLQRHAH